MTLPARFRSILTALTVSLATLSPGMASAQLLSDTFSDGVPGNLWRKLSTSPSLRVTEQNGRLEFFADANPNLFDYRAAGYYAKGWQLRALPSSPEIRVKVTVRHELLASPAGTLADAFSEAGIAIVMSGVDSPPPEVSGLPVGLVIALDEVRNESNLARLRQLIIGDRDEAGFLNEIIRATAPIATQTQLIDTTTFDFYSVPLQPTLYLRYVPSTDELFVSAVSYTSPESFIISGVRGNSVAPLQFHLGGFAYLPGGLLGANAWFDNFTVDAGGLETSVRSLAGSQGTFTDKVRLTWTAASGATGYRIYRAPSTTPIATLGPTVTQYDDTTATPGTSFEYSVETLTQSTYSLFEVVTGYRALAAPTNVQASDGTSTAAVNITWNAVTGAQSYSILRAVGAATAEQVGTSETTSFTDTTAVAGTLYTYSVRAVSLAGPGSVSSTNTGWRNIFPPTGVQASDGTSSAAVNISWTAATGATGYKIFRAIGDAAPTLLGSAGSTATTFADASAVVGTFYNYTVRSTCAAGDSGLSLPDSGWRAASAPTNVLASDGTSTSSVSVTWNGVTGALLYRIYRAIGTGEPTQVGDGIATTFSDTTATPGVLYNYTVRVETSAGLSVPSTANSGWRNVPAPEGVTASDGTLSTGVQVTWTGVANAAGYKIFRAIGTGAPTQAGQVTGGATSVFLDTGAIGGTTYNFTVRAVTPAGDSSASASDSGWRNLSAPTNVQATDGTVLTGVNVTWNTVSGATSYKVLRALGDVVPETEIATVTAASFADTTALIGTRYAYSVRAVSASGTTPPSAYDLGWRGIAAPTGVSATDGTLASGVSVSWTPVTGATGYQVVRRLGTATADFTTAASPFLDETAVAGTNYSYEVYSASPAGPSVASASNTGWRSFPAPTGVVATDGTRTDGVSVNWQAVPGVTGYRVLRAIGAAAPIQVAQVTGSATTSVVDTTSLAGTTYTYTVRGYIALGDCVASEPDNGWRNVAAPANFAASNNLTTGVNLTWTVSPGATGYTVFRGLSAESLTELATPTTTPFLDTTAAVGETYFYRCFARTAAGLSAPSATVQGSRGLPTPGGIAASDGTSTDGVVVSWTAVPGVTEYRILRAVAPTTPTAEVGIVTEGSSYNDTSANPGIVYNYSVRSVFGGSSSPGGVANSGWRNIVAPSIFVATDGSSTTAVQMEWSPVVGASGYRIFRGIGAATPTEIGAVSGGVTVYSDTTAAIGTTYNYSVRGFTTPGNGPLSAPDSGWRNAAPPTALTATDNTRTDGVSVSWTAATGATGYRIYRSQSGGESVEVAQPTASPWLDTTALPGVVYAYSAKSRTASGDSVNASNVDNGSRGIPVPVNILATDGTRTDGVNITWGSVIGASEYRVFRALGSATPTVQLTVVTENGFLDTTAVPGTIYNYAVRAFSATGSLLSAAGTANTGWRNVAAPTAIAATDGTSTTGVTISWTPSSPATGVTGYRVFRVLGSAAATILTTTATTASSFTDTTAVAGTLYTYSVRAVSAAGVSDPASTDTGWRDVTPAANFLATDGTSTAQVGLTWTAVTGATGYTIYRGTSPTDLAELSVSATVSFNDTTATPGTKYWYQVAAQTQGGLSTRRSTSNDGWRNVPAPTGVAATDGTSSTVVTVSWNSVENATGYRVYRAAGTAAPTVQVADITDPAAVSWVDETAAPGALYNYAVRAKVAAPGDSAASASNTGYRQVPPPTAVFAGDGATTTAVGIEWAPSATTTGLTGYRIYRSGLTNFLASVNASTTFFNDSTAVAGQLYTYTVKSVFAAGESSEGPSDDGWRNLPPPTNVQASDGTLCALVRVTWTAVSSPNVTGYRILRTIGTAEETEVGTVGLVTTFDDTTISTGQTGSYKVQARMAPGDTFSSTANTGFPKVCFAGGFPTGNDGSDPNDPPNEPPGGSDAVVVDVVVDDTGTVITPGNGTKPGGGTDPSDGSGSGAGTGNGTTQPGPGGGSYEVPDCSSVLARIRAQVAELGTGPRGTMPDLAQRLIALTLTAPGAGSAPGAAKDTSPACAILRGDVNLDGTVDAADLAELLDAWAAHDIVRADIDRDGRIDGRDLALMFTRLAEAASPEGDGPAVD